MNTIQIKKRSGGYRTVCVPSRAHKQRCRELIPMLQKLVNTHCDMDVVHGFAPLRSPVTNAMKHIGYRFTLSMDLADFFDSVTPERGQAVHVKPTYSKTLKIPHSPHDSLWHKGVAKQGLPTSPIVANLAATGLDRGILDLIATLGRCVYTRYADDLVFSFDDPDLIAFLKDAIPGIAQANGFTVNDKKTSLHTAKAGRRIVTGVAVDDTGIHPTRAAKRRLRAARHNAETGRVKHFPARQWTRHVKTRRYHGSQPLPPKVWLSRWMQQRVSGLMEWCRLKPPGFGKRSAGRIVDTMTGVDALVAIAERKAP